MACSTPNCVIPNCGQHLYCNKSMPVLLRGSVARTIYERMQREDQLKQFDRRKWYQCDQSLLPQDLQNCFLELNCDEQTQQFLSMCYEKSESYFTHLFQSIARTFLCLFMSSTSANGLLGRGSMFVFSDKQFNALMDSYLVENSDLNSDAERVLLDLGAGDGKVTAIMEKYYTKVYTTEISPVMRKILIKRGYDILDIDEWNENGLRYDLISCLNLLDRCDKPITIITNMKSCLKDKTGLILLALVLPFSQYVEVNGRDNGHKACEHLTVEGNTFEKQLCSFRDNVLTPNGLQIVKWTKLPYLCEGDLDLTFYWLYDVVMLLKPIH